MWLLSQPRPSYFKGLILSANAYNLHAERPVFEMLYGCRYLGFFMGLFWLCNPTLAQQSAGSFMMLERPRPTRSSVSASEQLFRRGAQRTLIFSDVEGNAELLAEIATHHKGEYDQALGIGDYTYQGTAAEQEAVLSGFLEASGLKPQDIQLYPGNKDYIPFFFARDFKSLHLGVDIPAGFARRLFNVYKRLKGQDTDYDEAFSREEALQIMQQNGTTDPAWEVNTYNEAPEQVGRTQVTHFPLQNIYDPFIPGGSKSKDFRPRDDGEPSTQRELANPRAPEGDVNLVIFGHTHRAGAYYDQQTDTFYLNAGTLMGVRGEKSLKFRTYIILDRYEKKATFHDAETKLPIFVVDFNSKTGSYADNILAERIEQFNEPELEKLHRASSLESKSLSCAWVLLEIRRQARKDPKIRQIL